MLFSFTTELVSKTSARLFPDNSVRSFTNFLRKQLNLESEWQFALSKIPYPSMYQNSAEGKFIFFDKKTFIDVRFLQLGGQLLSFYYGFCSSHDHILQEQHKHSRCCLIIKVSRRTQKSSFLPCK